MPAPSAVIAPAQTVIFRDLETLPQRCAVVGSPGCWVCCLESCPGAAGNSLPHSVLMLRLPCCEISGVDQETQKPRDLDVMSSLQVSGLLGVLPTSQAIGVAGKYLNLCHGRPEDFPGADQKIWRPRYLAAPSLGL